MIVSKYLCALRCNHKKKMVKISVVVNKGLKPDTLWYWPHFKDSLHSCEGPIDEKRLKSEGPDGFAPDS